MSRNSRWILSILFVGLAASSAPAQVNYPVDDFEILEFDVLQVGPGGDVETQYVAPPYVGHIIGSTRRIQCSIGGNGSPGEATRAWLDPGDSSDDAVHAIVSAEGNVLLQYPLGYSADLTVGGTVDRIVLDMAASAGALVGVFLKDENLNYDGGNYGAPGSPVEIPLVDLANGIVDLENVTEISIWLWGEGTYVVNDIRLRGEGSGGIDIEIHDEVTWCPPLPSPPIAWSLWENPFVQSLYRVDLGIVNADAGFLPDLSMAFGAIPAAGGSAGHFQLSWDDFSPFEPTQFAFSIDVSQSSELVPVLFPPDPVHGPEGITLPFVVQLYEGGSLAGTSETWLTIDPGPLQAEGALTFETVAVTPNSSARGSGATGFTVSFLLGPGAAGVETIWPILEMTWWSEWTPNTSTSAPAVHAFETGRALIAAPSVTRGGTEIRADRPFETATRLLVHDVLGRRVAELAVERGTRSVRWDGRDGIGRPVPAGVYFVNRPDRRGGAARVVMLR